jgi:hypothetical protein
LKFTSKFISNNNKTQQNFLEYFSRFFLTVEMRIPNGNKGLSKNYSLNPIFRSW